MDTMIHIGADPKAVEAAANEIKGLVELYPESERTGHMGAEMFKGFYRMFDANGATVSHCTFTFCDAPQKRRKVKPKAKRKPAKKRKK